MSGALVSRLLDAAEQLGKTAHSSAFKRRAVSTAYYAVFHALAKSCADVLMPIAKPASEYERVYRAPAHATVKDILGGARLREHPVLGPIGALVAVLHSERERADYLPPMLGLFSSRETRRLVRQARSAVTKIEALDEGDRRTLATELLFKKRTP